MAQRRIEQTEVLLVGAGPSGAVAAGLLRKQGRQVLVLEKETFPRFSIGESLLPQSMACIEEAGMLQDVVEAGFQYKNGAAFAKGDLRTEFDFRDKFSPGWGTTYQVQRGDFDKVLADAAANAGAEVRYRHTVTAVDVSGEQPEVSVTSPEGEEYTVRARFLLDASGFARILPRLLQLERPSDFPVRGALFTHIEDGIAHGDMDRSKILISVHPAHHEVWFWTIPFSNGRCSQGVVATPEFLDPVFSSGVTIAVMSASLAARCIDRAWRGEAVDWQQDYAVPLQAGVNTFRAFVQGWYDGSFQDVVFHDRHSNPEIRRMIASILAGYAWDAKNPYVAEPQRRLQVLAELCRRQQPPQPRGTPA